MTSYGMGKGPIGPYGTNEGDIWSGEDSEVGRRLMERDGRILIHEMMVKNGKLQDCVYTVEPDNPDPEMQDLIARARAGAELYLAARAQEN